MAANEIVLVRHATTADTRAGLFCGHDPTRLDRHGQIHARAVGDRLRGREFDEILASPVARAWETAERAGLADRAEAVDALVEWHYGELVGRRTADVRADRPQWELWTHGAPDGETPADVDQRLQPVLTRLRAADGDVAVVSHGHVLRVLVVRWLGLAMTSAGGLVIDPGSITVLGYRNGRPALITLNDKGHLAPDER